MVFLIGEYFFQLMVPSFECKIKLSKNVNFLFFFFANNLLNNDDNDDNLN